MVSIQQQLVFGGMDLHGPGGPVGKALESTSWKAWLSGLPWFLGYIGDLVASLDPPSTSSVAVACSKIVVAHLAGHPGMGGLPPISQCATISTVANNELGYNSWPKYWLKNHLVELFGC